MLVHGKGDKEREMPVPSDVRAALLAYLSEVGERPGPLIRSVTKPWAGVVPRTLSLYMSRWMTEAGIKQRPYDGRSGHALRRTGATEICDVSGDIRLVQSFLGHEGMGNLKFYVARAELGRLRTAMESRSNAPPAAA
jgi:integrase